MRAKEIWALVPVPSHVVKKVVSTSVRWPCPDGLSIALAHPSPFDTLVITVLGCHCQVQKGLCS